MLEILAGRADIALADYATATKFVAEHPEVDIAFNGEPVSLQYAAFMLRRNDYLLREYINIALRNLDLSGALSAIDRKYSESRTWYGRVAHRPSLVK
jgi:ABC-type amino acid transport substrate-binding protein